MADTWSGPVFWLEDSTVAAFVEGRLDEAGERRLAEDVASLLAARHPLPNHVVAALSHVERHLGGGTAVVQWLATFPGRPRFVARVTVVADLLDQLSGDEAALAAIRDYRGRMPHPPGVDGHLTGHDPETTLGSLSWELQTLAHEGREEEAADLAFAVLDWLAEALAPVAGQVPALHDVMGTLPGVRDRLRTAMERAPAQRAAE